MINLEPTLTLKPRILGQVQGRNNTIGFKKIGDNASFAL